MKEELLLRLVGATVGSTLAVVWLKEASKLRKCVQFVSGIVFAMGSQSEIAKRTHWDEGFLLCFVLGLCSMALCSKVFETWQNFNLGGLARDVARKWAGLPPATSTKPAPLTKE